MYRVADLQHVDREVVGINLKTQDEHRVNVPFFTSSSPWSLELSDAQVDEPYIRSLLA